MTEGEFNNLPSQRMKAMKEEITRLQNEKDEALNQLDSALHSVDVLEKRNAQLLAKLTKADALANALKFYATATVEYPDGNVTFQPGDDNGQRAQEALTAYRETDT